MTHPSIVSFARGDGTADILISIASGGSGGIMYYYIYSFINNTPQLLFDFNANNVYELLAYQKIAGRYNADSLGYILNTLKWKDNIFILDNQYVAIF